MGVKEIYFKISSAKEKELFNFIRNNCGCIILDPRVNEKNSAVMDSCSMLNNNYMYVIVDHNFTIKYSEDFDKTSKTKFYLDLSSDDSVIIYHRETDSVNRIYVFSADVCSENINTQFVKIKKWIKGNSKKKITEDGCPPVFCVLNAAEK